MEIFEGLDPLLKTLWYVAIPSSIIFLVQSILTFIGTDSFDGVEADFEGDLEGGDEPFQLFSFRNLINFLIGFSWTGICFYSYIKNPTALIGISLAIGAGFVYVFFLTMKQIQKLAEDNTFQITSTLGKTAEVYLKIPENRSGKGKITISINGSYHELDAITENDTIPTGSIVKVLKIENENLLVVELI